MKVKLYLSLSAAAVMLFMLSTTGYAMANRNDRPEATGNIALEDPDRVTFADKAKLDVEVTRDLPMEEPDVVTPSDKAKLSPGVTETIAVNNTLPTSEKVSTKESLVSKWLEARESEAGVVRGGDGKSAVQDDDMGILGSGWCDYCGCWMRHGCDSNGTCTNGHLGSCGGGQSCALHVGINCGQY
jgi:hypothetical protein